MSFITVKCDAGKVIKNLDNLGKGLQINILALVRKHLERGAARLKAEHFRTQSDTSVAYRTGKLFRSVKVVPPAIVEGGITGGITIGDASTPYTKIHAGSPRGSKRTVKVKNKPFLTIPTDFAKTAGGVPRGPWYLGGKPNPIWGITFVRKGIVFGYMRGTARKYAKPVPLFILRKEVTHKTRVDPIVDARKAILPALRDDLKLIVKFSKAFK